MDVIYVKDSVFLENISFEERTSDLIAKNTCNTWQKKRDLLEKIKDTKQGKLAEKFVKQYIEQHTGLSYLEYDEIRIDNYEKHAPFDGLLYLKDKLNKDILDECIKKINNDVQNSITGNITSECRKLLNKNGLLIIEIKSTKVNDRKKDIARNYQKYNDNKRECLLQAIKNQDDFLTYLHFCRYGSFDDFNTYCNYVKNKYLKQTSFRENELVEKVKHIELENLSDIHIRIYIDYDESKAILIGYIKKEMFLKEPIIIKKMIKFGKSEGAVYLTKPLKVALPISSLEQEF